MGLSKMDQKDKKKSPAIKKVTVRLPRATIFLIRKVEAARRKSQPHIPTTRNALVIEAIHKTFGEWPPDMAEQESANGD